MIGLLAWCGLLLLAVALRLRLDDPAADPRRESTRRVLAVLPRTQCRQCGFAGCEPFAAALVAGVATTAGCRPGGEATAAVLAEMLGSERRQGNATQPPRRVQIDESSCIGCARCLVVCPVDAILGAPRQLHTILTEVCTGCEICLPACPVDCIQTSPMAPDSRSWQWPRPEPGR